MKTITALLIASVALGCKPRVKSDATVKGKGATDCGEFARQKAKSLLEARQGFGKSLFLVRESVTSPTKELRATAKALAEQNGLGTPAAQIEAACGCNDPKAVEGKASQVTPKALLAGVAAGIQTIQEFDKTGNAAHEASVEAAGAALEIVAEAPLEQKNEAGTVATAIHTEVNTATHNITVDGKQISPGERAQEAAMLLAEKSVATSPEKAAAILKVFDMAGTKHLPAVDLGLGGKKPKVSFESSFSQAELKRIEGTSDPLKEIGKKFVELGFQPEVTARIAERRSLERRKLGK